MTDEVFDDALAGERGETQRQIAEAGRAWVSLILRKNGDYGGGIFTTPILTPGLPADVAIRVRMSDKIDRLRHLIGTDKAPEINESIVDTLRDLGAYCLLLDLAMGLES